MKKLFIIMFLFLALNTVYAAPSNLHITTGFTPPVSSFFEDVLAEVDNRVDAISISFEVLPAERSLSLSNQDITDGDCCRIHNVVNEKYPNLKAVEKSFFLFDLTLLPKIKLEPLIPLRTLNPIQ